MKSPKNIETAAIIISILGIVIALVLGIGANLISEKLVTGIDTWTIAATVALIVFAISTTIFVTLRTPENKNTETIQADSFLTPLRNLFGSIGTNLLSNIMERNFYKERRNKELLLELMRKQASIYGDMTSQNRKMLSLIQKEMPLEHIEVNDMQFILDNLRIGLRMLPEVSSDLSEETKEVTRNVQALVDSELSLITKFEVTLPIIPFILEYKIEASHAKEIQPVKNELAKQWINLINLASKKQTSQ